MHITSCYFFYCEAYLSFTNLLSKFFSHSFFVSIKNMWSCWSMCLIYVSKKTITNYTHRGILYFNGVFVVVLPTNTLSKSVCVCVCRALFMQKEFAGLKRCSLRARGKEGTCCPYKRFKKKKNKKLKNKNPNFKTAFRKSWYKIRCFFDRSK